MPDFIMPVDFRINTRGGDLDIPAGATVHVGGDGAYQGFTHTVVEDVPAPAPEPVVEATPDPVEEVSDGETVVSEPEQPAEG